MCNCSANGMHYDCIIAEIGSIQVLYNSFEFILVFCCGTCLFRPKEWRGCMYSCILQRRLVSTEEGPFGKGMADVECAGIVQLYSVAILTDLLWTERCGTLLDGRPRWSCLRKWKAVDEAERGAPSSPVSTRYHWTSCPSRTWSVDDPERRRTVGDSACLVLTRIYTVNASTCVGVDGCWVIADWWIDVNEWMDGCLQWKTTFLL